MIKTIPAVKARVHLGEIMKAAFKNGDRFMIEKSGIPMVVILSASEYTQLIAEREERFKILDQIKAKLPETEQSEIEKDADEAVRSARKPRA